VRQNSSNYILNFLISSIFSVLLVRLFLHFTNYRQIVFGSWHIAHLFWGGLLMLISFILIFLYKSKTILNYASIIAGLGWGQYIDELGKYLSRDNDYFFRPAIILIYISFVLIFLVYYFVHTRLQPRHTQISIFNSFFHKLSSFRPLFIVLSIYSLYYAFEKIYDLYYIFISSSRLNTIYSVYQNYDFFSKGDNYLIFIKIAIDFISTIFILLGWFFYLTRRKISGLKLFRFSLLVNIFIGAVVKFYFEQFSAIFSLLASILVLIYISSRSKLVK
jgi:hypothetical protein